MRTVLLRCFRRNTNRNCGFVVRGKECERNRHPREEGFSVLEAMVAIAILATGLLPLLALQGRFVETVEQLEHAEQSLSAQANALSLIQTINMTETPRGEIAFTNYTVRYEAKAIRQSQPARGNAASPGRFELTLYDVDYEIIYVSGRKESFKVRQFGWRAVRGYLDGL